MDPHSEGFASLALPMLADAAIKGAALLLLATMATWLMRRASASARHLVWFASVVALLILPAFSALLPGWHILPNWFGDHRNAIESPAPQTVATPAPSPPAIEQPSDTTFLPLYSPPPIKVAAPAPPPIPPIYAPAPQPSAPPPPPLLAWQTKILLAWLAGSVLYSCYVLCGCITLWRLKRRSSPITDPAWLNLLNQARASLRFNRAVNLITSPRREMPMTWGLWRAWILLPEDSTDWPLVQRRAVLLHELAHARRGDCLSQLITQLAIALYWFNPLLWLAWKRMQAEREQACDDMVLATGERASAYAEQLLHMAAAAPAIRYSAAAPPAIAMARPSTLESRLRAILDNRRNRRAIKWTAALGLILALAAVAVPLAMVRANDTKPITAADDQGPLPSDFAGRLIAGIAKQHLSFLDAQKLAKLQARLADFDAQHLPQNLPDARRQAILSAIDGYAATRFHNSSESFSDDPTAQDSQYLGFADAVQTFEWQLWLAANRQPLSAEQEAQRQGQLQWIQQFVRSLPPEQGATQAGVIGEIDQLYADPLDPLFSTPMTEEDFEKFKKLVNADSVGHELIYASAHCVQKAWDARYPKIESLPTPFAHGVTGSWGIAGTEVELGFAENQAWTGNSVGVSDFRKSREVIGLIPPRYLQCPAAIDTDAKKTQWLADRGKDDLVYDGTAGGSLAGPSGTKLLQLNVHCWIDADRISDAVLRQTLQQTGRPSFPLAAARARYHSPPGLSADCFIGVLTAGGKLAVISVESFGPGVGLFIRPRGIDDPSWLPSTQPTGPSASVQDLSTPQEMAEGKFHWMIRPSEPVAYVVESELVKENGEIGSGYRTDHSPPDTRTLESIGSLTFAGAVAKTSWDAFYPKPNDVPSLWSGGYGDQFGLPNDCTYTDRGVNHQITQLTSAYVPLAWAHVMRGGHRIGTMFVVIRVAPADQWQHAIDQPVPRDVLRVPAGATPATQPAAFAPTQAAPSDGFAVVQWNRFANPAHSDMLLVGSVAAGSARITSLPITQDIANRGDFGVAAFLGVAGNTLYILGSPVRALDLRTGKIVAVPGGVRALPAMQSTDPLVRGSRRLEWGLFGNPAFGDPETRPAGYQDLILQRPTAYPADPTGREFVLSENYSQPPSNIANPPPPTVWLDDHHALTLRTGSPPELRPTAIGQDDSAYFDVMVIDLVAHSARPIGQISGWPNALIGPRGNGGDAIIVADSNDADMHGHNLAKAYSLDVASAIAGTAKLEDRPAHWGDFTLESPGSDYPPNAIDVHRLLYHGRELASDAAGELIVSVSPDGHSALWQIRPPNYLPNNQLYFYQSGQPAPQQLATTGHFGMPVWFTATAPSPAPAPAPATQPAAKGAVAEPSIWLEVLPPDSVKSIADFRPPFTKYPGPGHPSTIQEFTLEIRSADNAKRIAEMPNAAIVAPYMYGFHDDSDQFRRLGPVPDGDYLVAFTTADHDRRSNVIHLKIDSKYVPAPEPTLRVEPMPLGPGEKLPSVWVIGTGPQPIDNRFTNASVMFPTLIVDGVRHDPVIPPMGMPTGPIKPGESCAWCVRLADFTPPIAPKAQYRIKAQTAGYESAEITIPVADSLGPAWDAATAKLPPLPPAIPELRGTFIGAGGKPAAGAEVMLQGPTPSGATAATERCDRAGNYAFVNVPAGQYMLWAEPFRIDRISIQPGKTLVQDFSSVEKFRVTGQVTYQNGSPAVGKLVDVTTDSDDGRVEFDLTATTDIHGRYAVGTPFDKISSVFLAGTADDGPLPDPVYDAKASAAPVDLVIPANPPGTTQPAEADRWGTLRPGLRYRLFTLHTPIPTNARPQVLLEVKNVGTTAHNLLDGGTIGITIPSYKSAGMIPMYGQDGDQQIQPNDSLTLLFTFKTAILKAGNYPVQCSYQPGPKEDSAKDLGAFRPCPPLVLEVVEPGK